MRYLVLLALGLLSGCGYKLCVEGCAKWRGSAFGCAEVCAMFKDAKEVVK